MKKSIKKIMALLLTTALSVGSPVGAWALEAETFTDNALFSAGDEVEEMYPEEELFVDVPIAEATEAGTEVRAEGMPGITSLLLMPGKVGQAYSAQMRTDSTGIAVWSLNEGSTLPKGLRFSKSGLLSGTPEESGTFRLFVQVKVGTSGSERLFKLRIKKEDGTEDSNGDEQVSLIELDSLEIMFDERMEGYKETPLKMIYVKNIYNKNISLSVNHGSDIEIGEPSKTILKPGETAKVSVQPVVGLKVGGHSSMAYFLAKSTDGKAQECHSSTWFRVNEFESLKVPALKSLKRGENYYTVEFKQIPQDASGIQVVAVANNEDLNKEKYISTTETTKLTAKLKYLPKGRNYLYYRCYEDNKNGKTYGEWSPEIEINIYETTPTAPEIESASVRYCDLKLKISSSQKVDGYDVVLARKRNGTEPSSYAVTETNFSGKTKEIILYNIPKGTYYAAVHSYKRNKDGKKIISRWSELKKIAITKERVTAAPVLKNVTVSGRDVILTVTRSRGTHGSYWVLAKKYKKDGKYNVPTSYSYIERSRTEDKIVFKNIKPGNYYVSGRGYLSAYRRYYTKWSPLEKITVR